MSQIKVTSEELHTLSSQVMTGSNQIQDQLAQLKSQTSAISSSWEGTAHAQFQELYSEWDRSAAGLRDALDGISRLLGNAGTQYQATETGIKGSFAG